MEMVEKMPMNQNLNCLFETVRIGQLTVPNRIVMAPMTRLFAADGVLAPTATAYYRSRAEGGVGLILTEGIATSRIAAQMARVPHMLTPEACAAWVEVVEAVHGAGGRIMAQLWHTGLGRIQEAGFDPELPSIGPCADFLPEDSPLAASGGNRPAGVAMTRQDIMRTVEEFATAAAAAQDIGFDGIQLHGAHGYLIDQFFWAETNRRTDEYGGDISGRTRFASEIIRAIRARTGPDFVIGFRFSQWKLPEHYAIAPIGTPDELKMLLSPLVEAGVDFFDASTRRYWEPAFEGSPLNLAAWAKRLTGIPVMTVGSIGLSTPLDPTMAEDRAEQVSDFGPLIEMVQNGDVDMVGVGRALIANADWPDRIRTGKTDFCPFTAELLAQHS